MRENPTITPGAGNENPVPVFIDGAGAGASWADTEAATESIATMNVNRTALDTLTLAMTENDEGIVQKINTTNWNNSVGSIILFIYLFILLSRWCYGEGVYGCIW